MVHARDALLRFIYSHHFFGGIRQAFGVLTPALILGGVFHLYEMATMAAIGAACVAIVDQPGSPRQHGTNIMLSAIVLGTCTAAITGFSSSYTLALLFVVPLLTLFFSMFTAFGKQGGLLGFACLLLMTLTMRTPLAWQDVLFYTLYSFSGGLLYFSYSYAIHKWFWHREGLQVLSGALFATASYMRVRADFYLVSTHLDDSYRNLIKSQAQMAEKHQVARNLVLRELPQGETRRDSLRIATLNTFIDMVSLLDTMIATQTDYRSLRQTLKDHDVLLFCHDALNKLADHIQQVALDVARNRRTEQRLPVKAELRAIEYEIEKLKRAHFNRKEPEIYALLVQILRRLRNATHIVLRLGQHMRPRSDVVLLDPRLERSLTRFLSRQDIRLGLLSSNLRLDSPHFRYAIRAASAVFFVMLLSWLLDSSQILHQLVPSFSSHSYWMVLTILVIMKPGFALTRQRNTLRLKGTILGCIIAFALFQLTDNLEIYWVLLVVANILGFSLIQLNYQIAAASNTVFVLLIFHLLSAGGNVAIGERLFDTLVASAVAWLCSYILPWWESNFMVSLAQAVQRANTEFFNRSLNYAELTRRLKSLSASKNIPDSLLKKQNEADLHWRLARLRAYVAFSNFTSAFYRMMDEPPRQQLHIPEFNHLLLQNHILASQITAATPVLAAIKEVPPGIREALTAISHFLNNEPATIPAVLETDNELATLAYPVRQMAQAAQIIQQEMQVITTSEF